MPELSVARRHAEELVEFLRPACDRIEIAGSIRRKKPRPTDIEIVCQPIKRVPPGRLPEFCPKKEYVSVIEPRVISLLSQPNIPLRRNAGDLNGDRWKRLWYRGTKVDLFCVLDPADWGSVLAIRTGPAEFSKLCVTHRRFGGPLPDDCKAKDRRITRGGEDLDTTEERDFFLALGLPCWPPEERTVAKILEHLKEVHETEKRKEKPCSY